MSFRPAEKVARKAPEKSAETSRRSSHAAGPGKPAVYDRLHAVLHSVRTIAHFEDALCVLLEHVKTAGDVDAALAKELFDLLEKLPSQLYMQDLEALRAALPARPAKAAKRAPAKRSR